MAQLGNPKSRQPQETPHEPVDHDSAGRKAAGATLARGIRRGKTRVVVMWLMTMFMTIATQPMKSRVKYSRC